MKLKMNGSGSDNNFSIEGLTQDKILAIYHALGYKRETYALSIVQEEVLDFLENHWDGSAFIAE